MRLLLCFLMFFLTGCATFVPDKISSVSIENKSMNTVYNVEVMHYPTMAMGRVNQILSERSFANNIRSSNIGPRLFTMFSYPLPVTILSSVNW